MVFGSLRAPDTGCAPLAEAPVARLTTWTKPDWQARAACRDCDPELFFPLGTTGAAVPDIEWAKTICATCPVQPECLDFALKTRQEFGIWGGTTEDERRALARAARKVPAQR
jgi:WhiB family redox-sensing transcriptional regulator